MSFTIKRAISKQWFWRLFRFDGESRRLFIADNEKTLDNIF